ncbi:MAG: AMMECR1 domain-containing protein [Fimbriimonadaceae bacterium]
MHIFTLLALTVFGGAAPGGTYDRRALLSLARAAIVAEVKKSPPPKPTTSTPVRPVFVTIEIGGNVHGCRGSLEVRASTLEGEIILAARAAASHDPRYRPISRAQLHHFNVTITVIEEKLPIRDVAGLAPADGIALESGSKWGIVLPWEGKDPRVRLRWAYDKAGVVDGAPANLYRLVAERF